MQCWEPERPGRPALDTLAPLTSRLKRANHFRRASFSTSAKLMAILAVPIPEGCWEEVRKGNPILCGNIDNSDLHGACFHQKTGLSRLPRTIVL